METHIHKNDLALGYVDIDGKIRNEVQQKVEEYFPASTYDRTETLDTIIYSIKKSLPAEPLLNLRKTILFLLGIEQDTYQQMMDDELNSHYKESVMDEIVKESQKYHYHYSYFYDSFRWRSYQGGIPIRLDDRGHASRLTVTQYGIQIYSSVPDFKSEFKGELSIMLDPLQHIMDGVPNPFKNTLSIQIEPVTII